MSVHVDNTKEELKDLIGATIEKVWIVKAKDEYDMTAVRVRVRYRPGFGVNGSPVGEYEIWQDAEGNGPGFLAFVGTS